MKMKIKPLILVVLAISTTLGCTPQQATAPTGFFQPEFFQGWERSYEEEEPGGSFEVYRPSDWKLPAARYRNQFTMNRDGTCEWLVLHPTDRHYFVSGLWRIDGKTIHFSAEGVEPVSFQIVELTETLLRIDVL